MFTFCSIKSSEASQPELGTRVEPLHSYFLRITLLIFTLQYTVSMRLTNVVLRVAESQQMSKQIADYIWEIRWIKRGGGKKYQPVSSRYGKSVASKNKAAELLPSLQTEKDLCAKRAALHVPYSTLEEGIKNRQRSVISASLTLIFSSVDHLSYLSCLLSSHTQSLHCRIKII